MITHFKALLGHLNLRWAGAVWGCLGLSQTVRVKVLKPFSEWCFAVSLLANKFFFGALVVCDLILLVELRISALRWTFERHLQVA